ncbi:ATP-dependent RNA helicase Dbp3 [Schizosaccharomyces japonicus yFS275]|uniref:RNA helicase n=1 Tax=Schizosaccharomyces japonicus (strain yFS275 / FY16936) TaxID=402676 RepID=B6K5V5_SCHJY|nr:ATP-dependent RNA helicase Dbp3 [Schizosaccharomyces japonicus yFS275]EEB08909.1 ATP-dependent RNA helicase Dbp3 [Schizosaccharomyces japonicus yFS275]
MSKHSEHKRKHDAQEKVSKKRSKHSKDKKHKDKAVKDVSDVTEVTEKITEKVTETVTEITEQVAGDVSKKEQKSKKSKKDKSKKKKHDQSSEKSESGSTESADSTTTSSTLHTDPDAARAFMKEQEISIADPTTKEILLPLLSFDDLPLPDKLTAGLRNFKQPTPIQAASWPYLLAGRDVVGIAETGSGKTVAFGIPALRYLNQLPKEKHPSIRVLVVSPTRELAIQTYENMRDLLAPLGLNVVAVYGGAPKFEQARAAREASVIIGTPGRLLDLINDGAVNCSKVGYLVLDEADRMLDTGFEQDIRNIMSATPNPLAGGQRQTVFFSATWPESVRELASTFLKDPVKITIGSDELAASHNITQIVEVIDDPRQKEYRLEALLRKHLKEIGKNGKVLVFALYKKEAARVENTLRRKFDVVGIHGDLSQAARIQALDSFKSGRCNLLVATDVAARGLDIPQVQLVINLTFPLTIEDYIHRIGRTGRANTKGTSITLFTPQDKGHAGELINVLRQANQTVPDELLKFGTAVKPKLNAYGARVADAPMKAATKIVFD